MAQASGTGIVGRRAAAVLLAGAFAAVTVVATLLAGPDGAAGAPGRVTVVLGKTSNPPDPACPQDTARNPCQAVGSVTAFQTNNGQQVSPYRVNFDGRVVAWSISLAQPTNSQRAFFNGLFGQPPEARIAVLKRLPRTRPPQYYLLRQSAIRVLSPYLGNTVRFKLGRPLRVRRHNIVALTIPTWAPAFAVGLSDDNKWRASRKRGSCGPAQQRIGRPQQVVKTKRAYGCQYRTSRLLYTATVVKSGQ